MPPKRKNSLTPQTTNTKKVKSKEGAPDASQNENEKQPTEAAPTQKPVARGRGRPRKHPIVDQQKAPADQSTSSLAIGNPPPLSAGSNLAGQGSQVPMTEVSQNKEAPVAKPRRGRPRKNPIPVESAPKVDLQPAKETSAKVPEGNDKSAPPALSPGTQQITQQKTHQPAIKDAATITDITISNGSQSIDLLLQHSIMHTQKIIKSVGESPTTPKKRGRPKKVISAPAPATASQKESVFQPVAIAPAETGAKISGDSVAVSASPTKGKRGRPRKNPLPEGNEKPKTTKVNKEDSVKSTSATLGETQPASTEAAQQVTVVKKGRGRPRKNTAEDKDVINKSTIAKSLPVEGEKPKSKRGRPKKQVSPEESAKLAKPKDSSAPTQARRGRPPKRKTLDNVQPDASWSSQAPERVDTVSNERSVPGGSTVSDKPSVKKPRLDGTGSIEDIIESVKYAPQPDSLVHEERLKKLENMRNLLSSSSQANREEVFAEHQRKKINHKEEVRREYKKTEAEKLLARQEIERAGGDYERLRSWTYSAEEAEKWEKREEKKAKRKEIGFTDYNQVAEKKYNRQIHELKPDLHAYQEAKAQAGASSVDDTNFYRDANSLAFAGVDSQPSRQAVERLVTDVSKQIEQREKFSRQKPVNEEEDITYINERNRHFNEKIDRYYGKYTKEIRENFERGTAL